MDQILIDSPDELWTDVHDTNRDRDQELSSRKRNAAKWLSEDVPYKKLQEKQKCQRGKGRQNHLKCRVPKNMKKS